MEVQNICGSYNLWADHFGYKHTKYKKNWLYALRMRPSAPLQKKYWESTYSSSKRYDLSPSSDVSQFHYICST